MIPSTSLQLPASHSSGHPCPPELFDRLTDILAEMALEDLRQHPRIPSSPPIDSWLKRENTSLPTQRGGM